MYIRPARADTPEPKGRDMYGWPPFAGSFLSAPYYGGRSAAENVASHVAPGCVRIYMVKLPS